MKKNKVAFLGILTFVFLSKMLLAQQPDWYSTFWPHEEGINYDEPYRGQFHFSPMSGWMNDINMLVYHNGLYYMTYQADHPGFSGEYYGHEHMSQGLATSPDLLHWTDRGLALTPTFPDFGLYGNIDAPRIFSGSGVVVSGTVAQGITGSTDTAMIAIFTGTEVGTCLAWSNDGGRTWNEYSGNPVANPTDNEDPRDPCVIWHEPEQKWVMAIWENGTTFYESKNLIDWNFLSNLDFGFECPDFFELPLDGDPANKKWVLQDALGAYLVGEFDGTTFLPEEGPYIMDQGPDFYAAQSFSRTSSPDLPEDRVIQIAWLDNWNGGTATTVWEREATFPVEIDLVTYRGEMRIKRTPIPEISTIYESTQSFGPQTITAGTNLLSGISSKKMDIIAEFDLTGATADEIQFQIANKTINYNIGNETITTTPAHPDTKSTVLNPLSNNHLKIRILADWGQLEIFGNDGVFSYSEQFAFSPCDSTLALTTVGGNIKLVSMEFNEVARIWSGSPQMDTYEAIINTVGNGSVNTDLNCDRYPEGIVLTLTAVPDSGYQFDGWSGDTSEIRNPLILTMDSDKSITANFSVPTETWIKVDSHDPSVIVSGSGYDSNTDAPFAYMNTWYPVWDGSVSFTFTGTKVRYYAVTSQWNGEASIKIDDTKVGTASTYSSDGEVGDVLVWQSNALTNSSHTIEIIAVDEIGVDAFEYVPDSTTSAVTNKNNPADFLIYPNPAKTTLYIDYGKTVDSYEIYSVTGKLVDTGKGNIVDASDFLPGLYAIVLNEELKERFIKY